jgi:hypothetical protein
VLAGPYDPHYLAVAYVDPVYELRQQLLQAPLAKLK